MTKISDYLIDYITGKPSSARLCALWGLIGTITASWSAIACNIFLNFTLSWPVVGAICAPGIIGIIPLCVQYINNWIKSGAAASLLDHYKGTATLTTKTLNAVSDATA